MDLLASRHVSDMFDNDLPSQRVSDESNADVEVYKVTSLPTIIERYVAAPIRVQSVLFVYDT